MPGYPSLRTCLPFNRCLLEIPSKEITAEKLPDIFTDQWQDIGGEGRWTPNHGRQWSSSLRVNQGRVWLKHSLTPRRTHPPWTQVHRWMLFALDIPPGGCSLAFPTRGGWNRDTITVEIWLLPCKPSRSRSRPSRHPFPPLMWRGCRKASLARQCWVTNSWELFPQPGSGSPGDCGLIVCGGPLGGRAPGRASWRHNAFKWRLTPVGISEPGKMARRDISGQAGSPAP